LARGRSPRCCGTWLTSSDPYRPFPAGGRGCSAGLVQIADTRPLAASPSRVGSGTLCGLGTGCRYLTPAWPETRSCDRSAGHVYARSRIPSSSRPLRLTGHRFDRETYCARAWHRRSRPACGAYRATVPARVAGSVVPGTRGLVRRHAGSERSLARFGGTGLVSGGQWHISGLSGVLSPACGRFDGSAGRGRAPGRRRRPVWSPRRPDALPGPR
jgi:hypothetical protein